MSNFNPHDICHFCLCHKTNIEKEVEARFWWNGSWLHSAKQCTYGYAHEYPEVKIKIKQVAKVDKNLCLVCKLHKRNPLSATNGCEHKYEQ